MAGRKPNEDSVPNALSALRLIRESAGLPPATGSGEPITCRGPGDVFALMRPYAEKETTEVFWILALDAHSRVLFDTPIVITRGILNSSLVHPREVFRAAIVAGAAGVILVHNHPSGDPTPSADDRAVTQQLVAAGRLIDLPVYDHVIVGNTTYASFAELGLL
jgi:DNA repair protein RadC